MNINFKKRIIKITLISILVLIVILVLTNPNKITRKLPLKTQISVENTYFEYYNKMNDSIRIILRTAGLDPFNDINKRYKRKAPRIENLNNDYNVKFLPNTQYGKMKFIKKNINFDVNLEKYAAGEKEFSLYGLFQPFYLESYGNKILIIHGKGRIIYSNLSEVVSEDTKDIKFTIISSNLLDLARSGHVNGTLIHNNKIYVSYHIRKEECEYFRIVVADINIKNLEFKEFYSSNECGPKYSAGRMQFFNHESQDGLLVSIGMGAYNKPSTFPQDKKTIISKIIFINLDTKKHIIYSLGHRNPQGLLVDGKNIISTEHGPHGGDEINKIIFQGNYGWPIASYGTAYDDIDKNEISSKGYLKSHSDSGFIEPVYAFVPSIGISQIIKIPNSFSNLWQNNYLLSSLNDQSLYRIKFNKNIDGILSMERIYVGSRIRDLKYFKKANVFILALEDQVELGILKLEIE